MGFFVNFCGFRKIGVSVVIILLMGILSLGGELLFRIFRSRV